MNTVKDDLHSKRSYAYLNLSTDEGDIVRHRIKSSYNVNNLTDTEFVTFFDYNTDLPIFSMKREDFIQDSGGGFNNWD